MTSAPVTEASPSAVSATVTPGGGMMMPMHGPLDVAQHRLAELGSSLSVELRHMLADAAQTFTPDRLGEVAQFTTGQPDFSQAMVLFAGLGVALLLSGAAGLGLGWLLTAPRHRLSLVQTGGLGRLLTAKLNELALGLAPPALMFIIAQLLAHGLLQHRWVYIGHLPRGSDGFEMATTGVISAIVTGWAAQAIVTLPLSATRAGLKLVPLTASEAAWSERTLRLIILVAIGGWVPAYFLYATHFGIGVPQILALLDGFVVAVLCLAALWHIRHSVTGFAWYWHRLAVVSVLGLTVTWWRGILLPHVPPLVQVLTTVLVLLAIPAIDGVIILEMRRLTQRMVARCERRRMIFMPSAESDQLAEVERPEPRSPVAGAEMLAAIDRFTGVLHQVIAACVLSVAAVVLFDTWDLHLRGLFGSPQIDSSLGAALDIGLTALVGWYLWRVFEAGMAMLLARDDGTAQSRSRTVEPLLRSIGLVVIGLGVLMIVLSDLGINIAPLLASAGVVGIAVGFGAQTLIKDLFSGACFLIEDVFRIGEYIEAGNNAKGAVEKITLRTVALRHQNGPLHFVPYGSLGTVRNNSRDWVIDKFEIPLPIDTDSEQIRKMVKKIGQQMLEDDELAQHIMAPLKAKLHRIEPGVKIFRCKVQTEPGMQFEVRTEAYRRIEAALKEVGLSFATGSQSLVVQPATLAASVPLGLTAAAE